MTLDDIKDRCVIDEITGCWKFKGAKSDGKYVRVWAPNLNKPEAPKAALPGKMAVWFAKTGKPVPAGHRVFSTCNSNDCLCPDHIKCGTNEEWGRHIAKSGIYKDKVARMVASRKTGIARSVLTPETYAEVLASSETGLQIAKRLNVSSQTVSKARLGQLKSFSPVGSPFAGLMR
jgi:hypothetical protein